jgi:hypothetical protein
MINYICISCSLALLLLSISTNMDQLIALGDNLNVDTQDNLDKCVNDFSEILSPFVFIV